MSPIDRRRWWGYVEQIAGGALVAAALILAGLGIAHGLGAHTNSAWIIEAIVLVVLGSLALGIGFIGRRRRARKAGPAGGTAVTPTASASPALALAWRGGARLIDVGVLLFTLEPELPVSDPQFVVRRLGPVACYAADPTGFGARALDNSISRVGGRLTVRWHRSFFGEVPEAIPGTYAFRWDEQLPDGSWRLLATAYATVDLAPPATAGPGSFGDQS